MRGQEPLLQMRRAGYLPCRTAWVTDSDSQLDAWFSRNWHRDRNEFNDQQDPHLHVDESDVPELLDFCCLVGMQVCLFGQRGDDRARRLFAAIRKAGAGLLVCARDEEIWFYTKEQGGNGKRLHA